MTASKTTIDLIVNLGQDVLKSVATAVTVYIISVSFTFVIVWFISVADVNSAPHTIGKCGGL